MRQWRGRAPMVELEADEQLLAYIGSGEVFRYNAEELAKHFRRCNDHPGVEGHIYYEGYYHGLEQDAPVAALNPRKGGDAPKPAAPRSFRAFLQAFKRVNHESLVAACAGSPLETLHAQGLLLADVAVQVHWGAAIDEKHVNWHIDAPNSMLHLAVSINGKRTLHYRTRPSKDDMEITQSKLEQNAGSLYLSAPYAYPHGVQYHEATHFDDRIVAVQCRTLISKEALYGNALLHDPDLLAPHVDRLGELLTGDTIRLPTLDEVLVEEERLQQLNTKRSCVIM